MTTAWFGICIICSRLSLAALFAQFCSSEQTYPQGWWRCSLDGFTDCATAVACAVVWSTVEKRPQEPRCSWSRLCSTQLMHPVSQPDKLSEEEWPATMVCKPALLASVLAGDLLRGCCQKYISHFFSWKETEFVIVCSFSQMHQRDVGLIWRLKCSFLSGLGFHNK